MRGILRKKGASHIEMIISFILFGGFVFFLLLFVRPYNTTTLSGSVVLALYDSFEEEAHTNLSSVFLKSDPSFIPSGTKDCYYLNLREGLFRFAMKESLVMDINGVEMDSSVKESGELSLKRNEIFYKVFISPVFDNEVLIDCEEITNYEQGSLIERRLVSYDNLVNMSDKYTSDYLGLKRDLNFPEDFDFVILSETLPEINMERLIPNNNDVQAREYLEEVLYNNGTIINAKFNLIVWQ